jgi:phytoene dehydrogenase-like protein
VVTVLYPTDFAWWEKLEYKSEAYKAEKKRILDITIAQLELELPGISSQIEISDVSTPYTTHRYTNNWKGAIGFVMTDKLTAEMTMKPLFTLPGLENFYMVGQWVKGFGLPMSATTGKDVIKIICKKERMKFIVD